MAGMLPGVESARRRRLHGSCDPSSSLIVGSSRSTRQLISPSSFLQTRMVNQVHEDDKLGGVAKEAKERLDGRLRGHSKQDITSIRLTSKNIQERLSSSEMRKTIVMKNSLLKKNGSKMLRWGRMGLSWKSWKEDDCAICLDKCKASEKITLLHCTHRFHSGCLLPWLEGNTHCPCCRAIVYASTN